MPGRGGSQQRAHSRGALHAAPTHAGVVYEALLRALYDAGATITAHSHPLPQTNKQLS